MVNQFLPGYRVLRDSLISRPDVMEILFQVHPSQENVCFTREAFIRRINTAFNSGFVSGLSNGVGRTDMEAARLATELIGPFAEESQPETKEEKFQNAKSQIN